jgi:hypothetical protein
MRLAILSLSLILTACGGGGISTPVTDTKIVPVQSSPIPVLASSFENEMTAAKILGTQNLPLYWKPCGDRIECGSFVAPAIAFADFMRDGSYSMITHTMEYNIVNSLDLNRKGHIKFYQSVNGTWVDNTSKILKPNQTEGCLHAGKAIVADFLQNGMPSVFFACFGSDSDNGVGERQRMLLGQRDGTYKNVELPVLNFCRCSSASAADVNGDGYPDIVLTDDYRTTGLYFLINNKDGTFTVDYTRFHTETLHKALFAVELIDFNNDGKYDVIVSGVEQCCKGLGGPAKIYHNVNGFFTNGILIPSVPGFGMVLDIVYDNGYLYLSRTIDDPNNFFNGFVVQRIKYPTMESKVLYESYIILAEGKRHIDLIIPYGNNIVAVSSLYKISIGK